MESLTRYSLMPYQVPSSARFRRPLLIIVFGLCGLVPNLSSALQRQTISPAKQKGKPPASSPSPTPEPSAPVVDFQVIPDRDSVGPDDEIRVSVFVANKSSKPITNLKLNFPNGDFQLSDLKLPGPLPPFGSLSQTASMRPKSEAYFGAHKLLFSLEYTWNANGAEFVSSQPATATVSIARRFEEEAKGFPGGTAAFLYLLLPIIPAILSYQLFEGRRKGDDWKLPSFGTEYVVPAFLVAVVVNVGLLLLFQFKTSLGYSDPLVFIAVLLISAAAGAVLPLYRWRNDVKFSKQWAFTDSDTRETYLRKALLVPGPPPEFQLAKGTVDDDVWEGLLLRQPDGATVLGAILQVSYPHQASEDEWNFLIQNVVDEQGVILNAERLVRMVEVNELKLSTDTNIIRAGRPLDDVLIIDEVKNWKRASSQASPLVIPST
jgi:hypothetical protein